MEIKESTRDYFRSKCASIKAGYVSHNDKLEMFGSGLQTIAHLFDIGVLRDGISIFEMGCGNGRLAAPLVDWNVSYFGVDVTEDPIKFCQGSFEPWKDRFRFLHLNLHNEYYNPAGDLKAEEISFPADDKSFDTVLLCSVMTHIANERAAERYLSEAVRVLKDSGKIWVTWFRSPPNGECLEAIRTSFKESFICNLISRLGLKMTYTFGGFTSSWHDQWETELTKK